MKHALNSESVSFTFLHEEEAFLKNIDFRVSPGECILICGKSGSGKTTFSRLLNGVSPNYIEGELEGNSYTFGLTAGEAELEDYVPIVGSVFQNPKTQHFSVDTTSELAFPCENIGMQPEKIRKVIHHATKEFEIEHLLDRDIFELSGGEKQQIAFVSANMLSPKVLILDEVTSNLDKSAISHIKKMIRWLKKKGITVVLTEHRLAWTKGIVDRYVLFSEGKRVKEWSAEAFKKLSNEELNAIGLRALDLSPHQNKIKEKKQAEPTNEDVTLQTKELSIGYDERKKVLENLSIGLNQGEIFGLMGANGSGKSTLAKTITGLLKPLAGDILWNEKPIFSKQLIKKSFLVMQDTNYQLFSDSVANEVLLGAKFPEEKERVLRQLNLLELEEHHPMSLSGGQKQRVAIASALLSGKELIVFDEPTSGLDFYHMQRFGELLIDLKEMGVIVVVITHDEELAANWCDSILQLEKLEDNK